MFGGLGEVIFFFDVGVFEGCFDIFCLGEVVLGVVECLGIDFVYVVDLY